jgi:hypothetical protein
MIIQTIHPNFIHDILSIPYRDNQVFSYFYDVFLFAHNIYKLKFICFYLVEVKYL